MSNQSYSSSKEHIREEFCSSSTITIKDQNDRQEIKNMCSVLNVVIDYTMETVTPMEAEEWNSDNKNVGDDEDINNKNQRHSKNEKDNNLLVPVIRIFGPLLRDPRSQPLQSACLYIHGAFPYILARPVVAGPDGSVYPSPTTTTHVDWDDRDKVEEILAEIQATLEETLQSSFLDKGLCANKKDDYSRDKINKHKGRHCPIIRKVTVLEGRGFYTFCPGPSTMFLRIEYYDPKLRWKVKLSMERGLQLPRRFHPDSRRYGRTPTMDETANDLLQFNCYEAHIPYTMQFFKDHNLAGMAYIHIRKGRIRGNLPKRYYPRNELDRTYNHHQVGDNSKEIKRVFLQSNTSQHCCWPSLPKPDIDCDFHNYLRPQLGETQSIRKENNELQPDEDFSSFCCLRPEYSPPSKNSSCDVEIDCSVYDIQNVDDIITSLPSDQNERDKIQWRAVPSLHEIWREERARMKKLLSPELTQEIVGGVAFDDSLIEAKGNLESTAFTLDVKKNAPRSGTKLATKGMWSLVNISGGLQEEFLRSLIEIMERHKDFIKKIDQELKGLQERKKAHRLEKKGLNQPPSYIDPSRDLSNTGLHVPSLPAKGNRSQCMTGRSQKSDRVQNQLLKASCDSNALASGNPESTYSEEKNGACSLIGFSQYNSSIFEVEENSDHLQNDTQSISQPLSYSCTQDMHERAFPMTLNPPEFSQRMERGDSILYTQDQDLDDLIDPNTLAPYARILFGEECCRATFLVDTDLPNLRRICGFRANLCPRGGHEFAENRVKPGLYRTITSGMVVDGLTDVSKFDGYDGGEGEDEDYQVLEDYCRRSQKFIDGEPKILTPLTQIPIATRLASTLLTQAIDKDPDLTDCETVKSVFSDTALRDEYEDMVSCEAPQRLQKISLIDLCSQDREKIDCRYDFSPKDNCRLPQKLTCTSNIKKPNHNELSIRTKYRSKKSIVESSYFKPISRAPSLRDVKAWSRKRKKRKIKSNYESTKKKTSANQIGDIKERKDRCHSTRKRGPQNQDDNIHAKQGIWRAPKQFEMTMTQGNPREIDSCGDKISDPSSEGRQSSHSPSIHSQIQSDSQESQDALDGIHNQGGRIFVQGGGGLKAKTRASKAIDSAGSSIQTQDLLSENQTSFLASPITMMAVEVHVQNRVGTSRLDSKNISMAQDSSKDKISALTYVYARDRGGGENLEILSRGCICLTLEGENPTKDPKTNKNVQLQLLRAMPRASMGIRSPLSIDVVKDERHLLRRFKDIVRMKDPDLMLSWDTQGAGLGYIIERGHALGKSSSSTDGESHRSEPNGLDMAKLLGRTPMDKKAANFVTVIPAGGTNELDLDQINETNENVDQIWQGSGLGGDWDDRVGAGVAAASIVGRLVFSGWKIVAEEVKHANASYLPAVVFAVLNKRIPHHDDLILTKWYANSPDRWRTLGHKLNQTTASLLLFDALDIIGRAGEAARLSGVEFSQSFPGIRGSQYKVEGVLLRALQSLRSDERGSKRGKNVESDFYTQQTNYSSGTGRTKSQSQSPWKVRRSNMKIEKIHRLEDRQYFFFSPSQDDIKEQEALEVQALTLEPQSGHFTDPVVVCDFTALYPSLIIAYNLCYSTCAGKLDYHSTRREMQMEGKTRGKVGPFFYSERRTATVLTDHFKSLSNISREGNISMKTANFTRDRAYVAPTGTIYVSESVLKGVLPQVLDEMLTTRAMLKKAAKEYKKNVKDLAPAILRQLEARQLALKYVANVTYGYTSATFSGRCAMPLLADTIVECGRRTLQRAMHLASQWGQGIDPWGRNDTNWIGAEVIYGDTDSLFIRMPGRSYKEAFEFGERFCKAVTSLNPPPVQLKLEKVYVGSMMQTMKRYCGMKFDSKDQKKPTFEAKGLEIIRRDQCALTQKVMKNALITLFKHGIQAVKEYLFRQWSLIFAGDLPVSDFVLTGRVRSKYRGGKEGPVQAVLARRLAEADPGLVIRHKQRISYVIVATPGVTFRLKDCVLTPLELLERWDAYKIHSGYYIEKHVNAALQRCLGLSPHFISVAEWYGTCPKPRRRTHFWPIKSKRAMITAYFGNDVCSLCQRKCQADGSSLVVVCRTCRKDEISSVQSASATMNKIENEANTIAKKCSKCSGCFESADTFAVPVQHELKPTTKEGFRTSQRQKNSETLLMPLANCVCIDCPITYERHRLREQSIEAQGTYDLLINNDNKLLY